MFSIHAPKQFMHQIMMGTKKPVRFVFFGSSLFSVHVLNELERAGFLPTTLVTLPPKPKGRNLVLTPTDAAVWAEKRHIPILTPETLKDPSIVDTLTSLQADVFIVASYGKIIPESVLYIPKAKTLNIHPSLLPLYRGASPVQSQILANEANPGVSIMELDKDMDHGPIVIQEACMPPHWPIAEEAAEVFFATQGAKLLVSTLSTWIEGGITPQEQIHSVATYTKKILKEDAEIRLTDDPFQTYLKILAYHHSPKAFFFDDFNGRRIRIIVTEASFNKDTRALELLKVIPEGKKEMSYADYLRGKKHS